MSKLVSFFVTVLLIGICAVAYGSTVLQLSIQELTKYSQRVVIGQVDESRSFEQNHRILTSTTIRVEETWKGDASSKVEVIQYGGTLNGMTTYVPGMPNFTAGERVLLFLEQPEGQNHFVVTGLSQGKFRIANAPDGLTPYAIPEIANTSLIRDGVTVPPGPDHAGATPLTQIESKIKSAVQ